MRKAIEEQIIEDQPTKVADESSLYRVTVDNEAYWVKKWHKSQIDKRWMTLSKVVSEIDTKGSSTSPYFHELRKVEYGLIHQVFPNITVEMVDSYDERIANSEIDEIQFDMSSGKPTTVTKEVVGDHNLMLEREKIVDNSYVESERNLNMIKNRIIGVNDYRNGVLKVRHKVEDAMHKIFGHELSLPDRELKMKKWDKKVPHIIKRLQKQNPDNTIIELLKWGILPIFPEGNFIPGNKETHSQPPHGTFIELKIYDSDKFSKKIKTKLFSDQNHKLREKLTKDLSYFELYKKLDETFYDVLFGANYTGDKKNWPYSPKIQTAVFKYLEAMKKDFSSEINKDGIVNKMKIKKQCRSLLNYMTKIITSTPQENDLITIFRNDLNRQLK